MKSPIDIDKILAERLRALRLDKHMTRDAVAAADTREFDSLSSDKLKRYEEVKNPRIHSRPNFETIAWLAEFYDVDVDYLLGCSDVPRKAETAAAKEIGTNEEVIQTLKRVAKLYPQVFAKCICAGGDHSTVLEVFCRNATMLETIHAETQLAITGGTQLFKNRYQILQGIEAIEATAKADGDLHFLTNAAIELENGHTTVLFKLSRAITNLMESIYPDPEMMIRSQVNPMLNALNVDPNATIDDAMVKHGREVLDKVLEKIGDMKLSDLMQDE